MKCWLQTIGAILAILGAGGFFIPDSTALYDWVEPTLPLNLLHLVSGVAFLAVSRYEQASRWTANGFGAIYLLAAILGIFTDHLFGLTASTITVNLIHLLAGAASLYTGTKGKTRPSPSPTAVDQPQEPTQPQEEQK